MSVVSDATNWSAFLVAIGLYVAALVVGVVSWTDWGHAHLPSRLLAWPSFALVLVLFFVGCGFGFMSVH